MAGGAESAEEAWKWALPMSSVPLYVQQEEQHDKAHNDQAYCLKHANDEIYLSHCACHYLKKKTLPKAQRTRGLSSAYQSSFFWSS